jgi:hypothetical protein
MYCEENIFLAQKDNKIDTFVNNRAIIDVFVFKILWQGFEEKNIAHG